MNKIFVPTVAALLLSSAAHAEMWQVQEGPQTAIKGVWNITTYGGVGGNARMTGADGKPLTYGLTGEFKNGGYVVHRINSSDKLDCVYIVAPPSGTKLNGSVICDGVTNPWSATRQN